ncbi:hypothetical protein H0H92_003386 [Tricholoma furcatifolium]|nr:hypothetical protein H0H92_003386 [Tricholoma furcatifolium]
MLTSLPFSFISPSPRSTSPPLESASTANDDSPTTPHTPSSSPIPALVPRSASRMPELNIQPFHGGIDQETENPRDFVNKLKRSFMSKDYSDADKVQYFEWSLKDGSPAMEWFAGLTAEQRASWASLCLAFDDRWPAGRVSTKSQTEKQEELAEARIKEEDLGTKAKVNGVEMYSHIAWADKVERLAKAIPDDNNLLVRATRDNMAPSLRSLVPHSNNTWSTFCAAVRNVSVAKLKEKKAKRAANEKMKDDLKTVLKAQQAPPTPSKVLAATLDRFRLGAPIPPPNFTQTRNPVAPRPAAPPTATNRPGRTDAEKWAMIQRLPAPVPATEASRTAHAVLVAQWLSTNTGMTAATEDRPFPLKPGTAQLGSGECTGCGGMGHYESVCTSDAKLHPIELRWHCKANSIRKAATAPAAAVNFVGDTPQLTEEDLDALERFIAEQRGQGNGDGSSD